MIVARGSLDGERWSVTRIVKRRLRDHEILADRDILIAEWTARGWSQDRIGRTLRIDRSLVSRRVSMLPEPVLRAVEGVVKRHAEIPGELRERFREALLDHWERSRAQRNAVA